MGRGFIVASSATQDSEASESQETLLRTVCALGNSQRCQPKEIAAHLPQLSLVLWRIILLGDGEASLEWANPATSPPLRVHAFETLLSIVGSTAIYMSKYGSMNVDGREKLNVLTLGRILALFFDEQTLFDGQASEVFDHEYWNGLIDSAQNENSPSSKRSQPKKKRHVRSNYDLASELPSRAPNVSQSQVSSTISSAAGDLATMPKPKFQENVSENWTSLLDFNGMDNAKGTSLNQGPKLDTSFDFQTLLRAAAADGDLETQYLGSASTDHLSSQGQSYSGLHGRRFHTMPLNSLTTIIESENGEDTSQSYYDPQNTRSNGTNILATGSVEVEAQSQPQMRRPRMRKPVLDASLDDASSNSDQGRKSFVPLQSDDQIEFMGAAFLDTIAADMRKG
jgi:hypothetical protein